MRPFFLRRRGQDDVFRGNGARPDRDAGGRAALLRLWREYRDIAWAHGLPFFATTPTRRANRARMERTGHGPELIAQNVALLRSLAQGEPMCVGGLMGCRGDA